MARTNGDERLAAHYRPCLDELGLNDVLVLITAGAYPPCADGCLQAIPRHVDFITIAPRACTSPDTLGLVQVALSCHFRLGEPAYAYAQPFLLT